MQRIAVVLGVILLFVAIGGLAQAATQIEGTVALIDPVAKTITFTDGRVVQFDPGARIFVNGREVTYSDVRPGTVVVMTSAVPTQPVARVTGTIAAIDPVAKTVTFTDGRMVQFEPNSRMFVNGREVTFAELKPGVLVVMAPATPSTAVVPGPPQVTAAPPTVYPRPYTLVDASGVVASVDRQNGIITLQDGRMLRVTDGRVWQSVPWNSIQPGADVFVNNAAPVGYRAPGVAQHWSDRDLMGRVIRVDDTGREILLGDGTVVRVSPSTRVAMGSGQTVAVKDLKPGDQVVVHVTQAAPATAQVVVPGTSSRVTDQPYATSFPSYRGGVVEADSIVVIRYPQSP
ncbi:MAG: hypothetical protein C5B48_14605 [Candidatus Rokuibacteriota bacterium]|nr:MAG: hypothetical protein C5B48_14605 [Candidatus Rokubacteria bacterium]